MPKGLWSQSVGRFSKRALFLSASALSLAPLSDAVADPLENTSFISVYGGYAFNEGDSNVDFDDDDATDPFLEGLGRLDPGRDGGMAGIVLGIPLSPAWDARASLTGLFFETDDADSDFATSGGPGASTAQSKFNLEYLDLELGYRPGVLPGAVARLFGGLRAMRAENEIDYGLTGSGKLGDFDRDIDLLGIGPRFGAEAGIPIGNSRASFSALGAGSVIFSETDHRYEFFNFDNAPPVEGVDRNSDFHVVYNLEARAALGYAITDSVQVSVGYQAQQWWDLTTTLSDVESTDTEIGDTGRGDFLSHGPFARITVKLGE